MGCSGKERRKSTSRKSLKVARIGKERVLGGMDPTVERFFSLPSQEQVDRGKLPLAWCFFPPRMSSIAVRFNFCKALLHLPHGEFGSFTTLTEGKKEEKRKSCFVVTGPRWCGVPIPPTCASSPSWAQDSLPRLELPPK